MSADVTALKRGKRGNSSPLHSFETKNRRETIRRVKGRVSRFGACASDNVSAVKPIVFGPIRSEYTTPAGYGGQVL